jgi:hypothetical protein
MKIIFISFCLLNTLLQANESLTFASGELQTTLVELYTSEGCSSCPPADNWLAQLKNDPRLWKQIIPIAFHVDYWDYIGWKDPFAQSGNTLRQQRHRQQNNVATVYTPGFVVAGKEWRGFFDRHPLPIEKKPAMGILKAKISNGSLTINFSAEPQPLEFNIVILGFALQTSVKDGENAGRLLQHDFVALEHHIIASATNQVKFKLPNLNDLRKQNRGIAIWVNQQNSLIPLQAVGGLLNQ